MQAVQNSSPLRRPLLMAIAALFAAATIAYSAIWVYYTRWEPKASLGFATMGFSNQHEPAAVIVEELEKGSAAEEAGLRPGDRIVAINGRRPRSVYSALNMQARGRPGDVVKFTVERPGVVEPLALQAVLRPVPSDDRPVPQKLAKEIVYFYPLLFLVVGLAVLFLRLQDRNAWLLALLFAGCIAAAPAVQIDVAGPPAFLRVFAVSYGITFSVLMPSIFYFFFAVFPVASPLDRRLPWLKWGLLAAGTAMAIALVKVALRTDYVTLMGVFSEVGWDPLLLLGNSVAGFGLGLVSLLGNSFRAPTGEARRKIRVIVWGTVASFSLILILLAHGTSIENKGISYTFSPVTFLPLLLMPLSIAYAVVKHRVLEIPLLVKRSARYLMVQRGFVLLMFLLSLAVTLLFVVSFSRLFKSRQEVAVPAGLIVGVGFGILLASASTQVDKRVTQRIDRAFFRDAFDARQILQDLAEKARTATNRRELPALLESQIDAGLHPRSLIVYVESSEGHLGAKRGSPGRLPPGLETIPTNLPELAEVVRRGQPWEVPPMASGATSALVRLAPLEPECLVPMLGRGGRLVGLLVLGPRLSEEPYSGEDHRLLGSVPNQAGVAFENIRLAEKIAAQMEAEQRATQEMEIAKQVQARLFPQKLPPLKTLEYVGGCIQAREVGGDYYDFLDLGAGRLGLVLADISGKGISGALLMANLQANLRSQYAVALEDPSRLLQSVNQLFYDSTAPNNYATLFFGDYEDFTRRLRYANCGHNAPMLLRGDGKVERLTATATVVGLFEKWECAMGEARLASGDIVVAFSDGVTEAIGADGEEFGEARLLRAIQAHRYQEVSSLLKSLVDAVQQFSSHAHGDDITLIVARAL